MKHFQSILKDLPSLMESSIKRKHRSMSHKDLYAINILMVDGRDCNADDIVEYLKGVYEQEKFEFEAQEDFYCGITNDIVSRKSAHEREDYDGDEIGKVFVVKCKSKTIAADVEIKMSKLGFSIGDTNKRANGAAPDSDMVYLYRIPLEFEIEMDD